MKNKILLFGLIVTFLLTPNCITFGQTIWPPEGMNMPGTWDGPWNNPPTINTLAGIQTVGGKFLLDTSLVTRRYRTLIYVNSTGGDIAGGTYDWKFSSGPTSNYWANSWGGITVAMNVLQNYTKESPTNNNVTVTDGKYYTVNFEDIGYTNTDAVWMETSAPPCSILSVTQSPLPGSVTSIDSVTVTVTLNTSKSTEENVYIRYTTDNWSTSSLIEAVFTSPSGTAKIPPQIGGTAVSYYVFSTTLSNPTSDFDMITLNHNNNGGVNYSYSVTAASYTINASAGDHGSITPSGAISVDHGNNQSFTFNPDLGYSVDSLIIDGVRDWDSTFGYTFYNVILNHSIRVTFARKVNVSFQVNMKVQMKNGNFQPQSGDIVTIRGDFNDWGNATGNEDTLKDLDNDSIYTRTQFLPEYQTYEYKFWKTDRNGLGYETFFSNRNFSIEGTDTTLPVVFFNNETPLFNVTFSVNMNIQMLKGRFKPDSADVVTVRGEFNDWGNSTNNPDTLKDPDNDSVYTKVIPISGNNTYEYKFWKTLRGGMDYESDIPNRSLELSLADTALPTYYFNNDNSYLTVLPVTNKWNMLSIPRKIENGIKTELFPTAVSSAFYYNGSMYQTEDTLRNRLGYWLKFNRDTSYTIIGDQIIMDSIEVLAGWNMIGSITNLVMVNTITSDPPDIVSGKYFTYEGGYIVSDSIVPGKAYWVKTNQTGKLYLGGYTNLQKSSSDVSGLSGLNRLILKDANGNIQTLYFTDESAELKNNQSEMPPLPPDGFDVRYKSNRLIEVINESKSTDIPILTQGIKYPLTISWDVKSSLSLVALKVDSKKLSLKGNGSVTIGNTDAKISIISDRKREVPKEFSLKQNYPNPFNPSTVIDYQLPVDSWVALKVYNLLGQEIVTLVDEFNEAGFKTVQFNADNLPTGIYMYRLTAESYSSIKKLVIVR